MGGTIGLGPKTGISTLSLRKLETCTGVSTQASTVVARSHMSVSVLPRRSEGVRFPFKRFRFFWPSTLCCNANLLEHAVLILTCLPAFAHTMGGLPFLVLVIAVALCCTRLWSRRKKLPEGSRPLPGPKGKTGFTIAILSASRCHTCLPVNSSSFLIPL